MRDDFSEGVRSKISTRRGSKTNRIRIAPWFGAVIRNSFRFAIREPWIVSTSGRPRVGPAALKAAHRIVDENLNTPIQSRKPLGELVGDLNLPRHNGI